MIKPEPTKRDLESRRKKELVFQTALELFREYGYDNVTIKMIAAASGIKEGSIYHFFGEKAGILLMLTKSIQDSIQPLILPTQEHLADPHATVLDYLTAQAHEYEKLGRDLAEVYCSTPLRLRTQRLGNGTDFRTVVSDIEPDLLRFIQTARERGCLKTDVSPEELAFSLICVGSGLVSIWVNHGEGYSLTEAARGVFASVLDAFLG